MAFSITYNPLSGDFDLISSIDESTINDHILDSAIHFEQSDISISGDQLNGFTENNLVVANSEGSLIDCPGFIYDSNGITFTQQNNNKGFNIIGNVVPKNFSFYVGTTGTTNFIASDSLVMQAIDGYVSLYSINAGVYFTGTKITFRDTSFNLFGIMSSARTDLYSPLRLNYTSAVIYSDINTDLNGYTNLYNTGDKLIFNSDSSTTKREAGKIVYGFNPTTDASRRGFLNFITSGYEGDHTAIELLDTQINNIYGQSNFYAEKYGQIPNVIYGDATLGGGLLKMINPNGGALYFSHHNTNNVFYMRTLNSAQLQIIGDLSLNDPLKAAYNTNLTFRQWPGYDIFFQDGTGTATYMSISNNGTTSINKGQKAGITTINSATYDLLVTDFILDVKHTSTAAVTSLTLPTAQAESGRIIHIKDSGGNSSTNTITIDTEGSEKIDGQDTYIINNDYESISLYCDGSNWFTF